jgi:hypothetical protein
MTNTALTGATCSAGTAGVAPGEFVGGRYSLGTRRGADPLGDRKTGEAVVVPDRGEEDVRAERVRAGGCFVITGAPCSARRTP